LFRFWLETKRNEHRELLFEWMYKELPSLYLALCSEEGIQNKNLALYILQTLWMTVSDSVGSMRSQRLKNFTEDFTEITPAILAILDCSRITGNQGFQQEVVGFLTSPKMDMPESNLIHLLQAAHKQGRHSIRELGLEPLQDYCLTTLKKCMAEAPRTKDDWSIEPSLACKCELCRKLGRFLKDKHEQRMEWPLAKENRQHMHQIIDSNDFPVMHTTRRTGSPFTLILEKTKAILNRG
jgi:hypothetical protein